MLLTCPHCKRQHRIDARAIPANAKRARCSGCQQSFPLKHCDQPADPAGKSRPRRIGVTISKGGVGKTTTSVNLAAGLALAGFRVLLLDTDTQGQSAFALGVTPKKTLADLVADQGDLSYCEQPCQNLWLLAGGKSLAGLKREIDRMDFGGERTLANALKGIEGEFDYIIVDTSPGWDALTVNVLFYINEILTPVSLEAMTLQGLQEFGKSLHTIRSYRDDLSLAYILPTFYDRRVSQSTVILNNLTKRYGDKLCPPIRYNVRLAEAPAAGQSIFTYAPTSKGAEDYRLLVRKVTEQSHRQSPPWVQKAV